jgi:hypothetical protein
MRKLAEDRGEGKNTARAFARVLRVWIIIADERKLLKESFSRHLRRIGAFCSLIFLGKFGERLLDVVAGDVLLGELGGGVGELGEGDQGAFSGPGG